LEDAVTITSKDTNVIIQLTASIKNLEIETSIAEKVQVGMAFNEMVRKEDPEFSKKFIQYFDAYIQM
jgi:hypothetical protein